MFKKILMPIDLQATKLAEKAVKIATDEARKHGADLHILTVIPGFGMPMVASFFPEGVMEEAVKQVGKELKKFVADTFPEDLKTIPLIAEGNPAEQVIQQANKLGVDLIIIPSHAKTTSQTLLGSCSAKVVEHAKCSVMVIKS